MNDIVYMDLHEFIELGGLHEINRLLLHPLGLALQLDPDNGEAKVWDYRDDPEGMLFGSDLISGDKAAAIAALMLRKQKERNDLLGYVIQPVETPKPILTVNVTTSASR